MQLQLAILDDQADFRHSLMSMIQAHFATFPELECHCREILTADELRPEPEGLWPWQAIFLDIELKNMFGGLDGLALARKLREEGFRGEIVFTTSHLECSPKGYEFSALRYLVKPVTEQQIKETLNEICRRHDAACWSIYAQGQKISLPFINIVYIEVKNHHLHIYCLDRPSIKIRGSVADVMKNMPTYFCLSHRSFIVNLYHVLRLSDAQVDLSARHQVPLSKNYAPDFIRRYLTLSGHGR